MPTGSVKLRPLGDRVVVKAISRESVTKSGIVLPDTAKEKPQKEVAKEAGVYKIFGAGNYLYKFDLCSKQQRKNNA